MLFVDDHHAEGPEPNLLGQQCMGADQDVHAPLPQPRVDGGPLTGGGPGREQGDPQRAPAFQGSGVGDGQPRDQGAHLCRVLLGEDLGRGHQRALVASLDRHQHGGEGHHRLARADVTLQQPVHGQRPGQIVGDGGDGLLLGAGEGKGQLLDEAVHQGRIPVGPCHHVADPPGILGQPVLAKHQGQLQPEQLVERQAPPGRLALGQRGRPVDVVERSRAVEQAEAPDPRRREGIGEPARPVEGLLHEPADPRRGEIDLVAQGVDGEHPAGPFVLPGPVLVARLAEHLHGGAAQLQRVPERADGPVEQRKGPLR